jgi:hypothetical protein
VVKALEACQHRYPLLFIIAHDWSVLREWTKMEPEIVTYINAKNDA